MLGMAASASKQLRDLRRSAGLTQADAAEVVGLSLRQLQRQERGDAAVSPAALDRLKAHVDEVEGAAEDDSWSLEHEVMECFWERPDCECQSPEVTRHRLVHEFGEDLVAWTEEEARAAAEWYAAGREPLDRLHRWHQAHPAPPKRPSREWQALARAAGGR
jgi:transcriptional regulator with XRE-family HTH domain